MPLKLQQEFLSWHWLIIYLNARNNPGDFKGCPLRRGGGGRLALDPAPTNLTQLRLQVTKFRISTSLRFAQDDIF